MVKLTELKPHFLQLTEGRGRFHRIDNLAEADGLLFLCPKCFTGDGHSVICWFEDKVPDNLEPLPGRWKPAGTSYEDLSFVVGKRSNSIALVGGCAWHGFITKGEVT